VGPRIDPEELMFVIPKVFPTEMSCKPHFLQIEVPR